MAVARFNKTPAPKKILMTTMPGSKAISTDRMTKRVSLGG